MAMVGAGPRFPEFVMALSDVSGKAVRKNPGPPWGFRFLVAVERSVPTWLFQPALHLGAGVAACFMPRQRTASAEYLRRVLGREPGARDIWRHFNTFIDSLMCVLCAGQGRNRPVHFAPGGEEAFAEAAASGRPVLYGTFHLGHGDLIGYLLGRFGRPVRMVRLRVENSEETHWMEARYGRDVRFLWVEEPESMAWAMKEALEGGESLAMKCDRVEQAGRVEVFPFLGSSRSFPFTIYHLSVLFDCPVVFAFAVGEGRATVAYSSPVYRPDPAVSREENLVRARAHFREVLEVAEARLRENPFLWFNFEPWEGAAGRRRSRQ